MTHIKLKAHKNVAKPTGRVFPQLSFDGQATLNAFNKDAVGDRHELNRRSTHRVQLLTEGKPIRTKTEKKLTEKSTDVFERAVKRFSRSARKTVKGKL